MKVLHERDLPMQTRDGITLYSDVYRPDDGGQYPVMIIRTPYDKSQQVYADGVTPTLHLAHTRYFPQRGYAVVVQDTRGRWKSDGEFYPYAFEAQDGYDTVEWAARQPWSNGKVAIVGKSYMGLVQYLAAPEQPPHLLAGAPMSAPVSHFENCVWRRGIFELGWQLSYVIGLARDQALRMGGAEGMQRLAYLDQFLDDPSTRFSRLKLEDYAHLPVRDWVTRLADDAPYLKDLLEHVTDGPFWHDLDVRRKAADIRIPMFHVGSWYDPFLVDSTEMFNRIRAEAADESVARAQKLMIGPWTHVYGIRNAGQLDFGPEAELDINAMELRWYDHWLKGIDTGLLDEPPVSVFVMGANTWRHEWEWPIARTQYTPMYLSSEGHANSATGDGVLMFDTTGDQEPDHYVYDPNSPVPTCGGTTLLSLGDTAGACDQREVEQRDDVLVYTSAPLAEAIEVTGPVTLTLYASTSAPDTDFMAKLVDVHPDGASYNVADGAIRARFRKSLSEPTPVTPGEVIEYSVDMWSTSHMFLPGHRIRLNITSSDFPRYDRNPNTGREIGTDTQVEIARQSVYHDTKYPSHLLLPVIPD